MRVVQGALISPIVFLYPEFGQFDYVGESSEDMTIWDVFEQIFTSGLPWDQNKFYDDKKALKFYVMVRYGYLIHRKMEPNLSVPYRRVGRRRRELLRFSLRRPFWIS